MDTNQPTASPTYAPASAASGMFGTKIPSSVAFIVGILLFFMPFIDIRCNNMSLQQVTGFELATGFKMKNKSSDNPFLNDIKTDKMDEGITKATTKQDKKEPNLFALVALGLGVLGLLLSFTKAKAAIGGAMVTGIASAGSLIGMMMDIKKKVKTDMPSTGGEGGAEDGLSKGLENFGKELGDKMNISVDFTPWFYVAVVAFVAAAIFCFLRFRSSKT